MTAPTADAPPPGLADHPLDVRLSREAERVRELDDGLTSRHLHRAEFADAYTAVQFDRAMRMAKRDG